MKEINYNVNLKKGMKEQKKKKINEKENDGDLYVYPN